MKGDAVSSMNKGELEYCEWVGKGKCEKREKWTELGESLTILVNPSPFDLSGAHTQICAVNVSLLSNLLLYLGSLNQPLFQ